MSSVESARLRPTRILPYSEMRSEPLSWTNPLCETKQGHLDPGVNREDSPPVLEHVAVVEPVFFE